MAKTSVPPRTSRTSSSPTWPESFPSWKSASATPWVRSGPAGGDWSCAMLCSVTLRRHMRAVPARDRQPPSARDAEEFLPRQRIVAKTTQHPAGDQIGARLVDAARRHAVMRRLDDHGDALGFEDIVDRIGDLRRQLFLDLQPLGIDVDHAGELADADHPAVRDVTHPGLADDGRHVVLAMTLEANAAQHDHLVVAFDLLKGPLQDLDRVLGVAGKEFLEGARDARRRVEQASPLRIVAGPTDDGADRRLDFGALGPLGLWLRLFGPFRRGHGRIHGDAFLSPLPGRTGHWAAA